MYIFYLGHEAYNTSFQYVSISLYSLVYLVIGADDSEVDIWSYSTDNFDVRAHKIQAAASLIHLLSPKLN